MHTACVGRCMLKLEVCCEQCKKSLDSYTLLGIAPINSQVNFVSCKTLSWITKRDKQSKLDVGNLTL